MTNSPANPGASDAVHDAIDDGTSDGTIHGTSDGIIEAFHMMWDGFPHGVLLLNRSRDIIAANKRAEERGVRTGIKCYQLTAGNNEIHQGCKANQALDEATAQQVVFNNTKSNQLIVTYWLPVDKDLYLHFNVEADLPEKTWSGTG